MEPDYRSWIEISLDQIARNFRAVREVVGPGVEVLAVVKAEAYGHGMLEVSRRLAAEGAGWFGVTSAGEGALLRQAGIPGRILVMADTALAALGQGLTPVVDALEDLRALDERARALGARPGIHLKIDSGMGRMGIRAGAGDIVTALRAAPNLELEGLMSHFASPAHFDSRQTEEQLRVFDELCRVLRPPYCHISATGAVAYGRRNAWKNMVRVGLALYGYVSPARGAAPPNLLAVKPALAWKTRVLSVKDLPAGAAVGYGALYRAPHPVRIAVVAAGYADGIPHRLSSRGLVVVAGRVAPILGAVSMDVTTIDVTEYPEVKRGDVVTLIGPELDAEKMAQVAGTISYDVLCKIQARVKRVYR